MAKNNSSPPDGSTEDFGVGLDIGTMNIVSARVGAKQKVLTKRIRDAFLDLPAEHKRMLRLSKTAYVELDGNLLVIGDDALQTANLFNREARRPLSAGMLASGELDAQRVISLMMKEVLGDPRTPDEKCCYSVPAAAIDTKNSNVTYHSAILAKILRELGYTPEPVNEALAIVYSECSPTFSGLGISFGSGMTNVCLSYNAMSALEFSLARGGDWIDSSAAAAVGGTAAKLCALKESGIDITSPKSREEEAIAVFIQSLIDYAIKSIIAQFARVKSELLVPKPIPIIVSGGSSLAGGFLDKFRQQFELQKKQFPIEISEIKAASDPMTAVSTGLLLMAQMQD